MAILKDLLVHSTARVLGSVYGASFIKDGGTSSQFLKADGSVDSNSYALTSQIPSVSDFVTKSGYDIITASKRFTSNIELYHASSDTPAIVFQRGNSSSYYDWKMYNDDSGIFRIQCNRNSSFANHITINADGFFDSNLPLRTSSSVVATGSVTAASFIKTGATTTNVLQAGGGDIALATVATTGSYSDLSGLPTIPTVPSFSSLGSTKVPVYLSGTNTFSACASFASGTSITLNGSNKAAQIASFYAPIDSGTEGSILFSNGANNSPKWNENILTIITVNDSGVNFTSNDGTKYINPLIGGTLTVQASNHWIKVGTFGKNEILNTLGIAHEALLKPLSLGSNDKFDYGIPIRIPSITIDEAGHITKGDDTLITIPEPKDEKVKQSPSTTTSWKKILLSCNTVSTNTASITADLASIAYYSNALSVKPSTGEIKAGGFIKDANSTNILLANGSSIAQSTFSTTDNKVASLLSSSPSWAKILFTSSTSSTSTGSITNATNSVYYINSFSVQPSTGEVDATSYRANGNNVYIGASTTSQCHQQYDATNKCLKFIFD